MKLPDNIERDLRAIEAEYAQRGGQQAGTPRLRGLRASIELELQRRNVEWEEVIAHLLALFPMSDAPVVVPAGREASFVIQTTNCMDDSRRAALSMTEKMKSQRDEAREFLGRDLKEAMGRVLTLELDCQHFRAALQEYLDWGAMTGSDRDLFNLKFLALLTPQTEPVLAPCMKCGTVLSADGDWYRICGSCRWQEGNP